MSQLNRIIRLADLPQFCGLKRTQIDQLTKEGKFPRPVKLSTRRIAWLESEIIAWQQQRIAERDDRNTYAPQSKSLRFCSWSWPDGEAHPQTQATLFEKGENYD